MIFPGRWDSGITGFIIVLGSVDITPPWNGFPCNIIQYWTVPLRDHNPGLKLGTPDHIPIGDTSILTVPKFIFSIGTVTILVLRFRKYGKTGRNHGIVGNSDLQTIYFGIFGGYQNSTVSTPGTIKRRSGCPF